MRNPWLDLSVSPPFILAEDATRVEAFNRRASETSRVHVELLPEPFLGDPNAPVVILGLNPSFSTYDLEAHSRPVFACLSRANLRHESGSFPFYLLNPTVESPGRLWWEQRLARLLEVAPREVVAHRILCIEYFPYHSVKFNHHRLELASQQYAFYLVRQAMRREAIVILMRSPRRWYSAVPELETYKQLFKLRNPQSAWISRGNCPNGFDFVLDALDVPASLRPRSH